MYQKNPMCYNCTKYGNECKGTSNIAYTSCGSKVEDESKKGMNYVQRNHLWHLNANICARFTRLNYDTSDYIYVGVLPRKSGWTRSDYIDIMSYYSDCIGYMEVTEAEAKQFSHISTGGYAVFLKLEKEKKLRAKEEATDEQ